MNSFSTPVLLLIFNRPAKTKAVFEAIRQRKPTHLYIAADGPRAIKPGEKKLCEQTREVVSRIDWDCEVKTLYRDNNLGSRYAVSRAIDWFFQHVEEGIILEDDCLPNDSFFNFCAAILEQHRTEPQIMMVAGTSFQNTAFNPYTYYFSRYVHVWGWATWKRAWQLYDVDMLDYNENKGSQLVKKYFSNTREQKLWLHNFKMILNGLDAWDYQWMYCIWKNNGFCITPWKNMIANIGFDKEATHTFSEESDQSKMKQYSIDNIIHPPGITGSKKADNFERFTILIDPPAVFVKAKMTRAYHKGLKAFGIKPAKNG